MSAFYRFNILLAQAPKPALPLSSLSLKRQEGLIVFHVRRERIDHCISVPDELGIDKNFSGVHICQGPAVTVRPFEIIFEPNLFAIDEPLILPRRFAVVRPAFLRSIHPYITDMLSVLEHDSIAVYYFRHP